MSKNKKTGPVPAGGGSSEPGREVRPDDLPAAAPESCTPGEIPIGSPIPEATRRAIERAAKYAKKPPAPGVAQSDTGADET